MGNEKLKRLGIDLPKLPTTAVGSYPKLDYIMEARHKFKKGKITDKKLDEYNKEATSFWIKAQEKLDMDVLVDGEQYRGDMVEFFAENIKGFKKGGIVRSYGNRFYRKPIIVDEIKWTKPVSVEMWKFASSLTKKPVKGMLTGPYTVMDWCFNEYYPGRKSCALAIAREWRKEVEVLVNAGAKIIQIDEPAVSVRPNELSIAIEAMNIITNNLPCYFITHICYGAFEFIYPGMLEVPVDNFDLEMSNSQLDLLELFNKKPFTKDFSFGVIDVHSHKVESVTQIEGIIRKALNVKDINSLWIDPDCGLKTRTVDETVDKLKAMVTAVKNIRKERNL